MTDNLCSENDFYIMWYNILYILSGFHCPGQKGLFILWFIVGFSAAQLHPYTHQVFLPIVPTVCIKTPCSITASGSGPNQAKRPN